METHTWNPFFIRGGGWRVVLVAHLPVTFAEWMNVRLRERPCLVEEKKAENDWGEMDLTY